MWPFRPFLAGTRGFGARSRTPREILCRNASISEFLNVTVVRAFWPFFEGTSRFGARIRILSEKLYRIALISEVFDLCEAFSDHISDFRDFSDLGKAISTLLANLTI